MLPTALQLADRFETLLKQEIGAEKYAEVLRLNKTEEFLRGACASHEFCDANMVMLQALHDFGIDDRDLDLHDEVQSLWRAAWNLWKTRA